MWVTASRVRISSSLLISIKKKQQKPVNESFTGFFLYASIHIGSNVFSAMLKLATEVETPSLIIPVFLAYENSGWEYRPLSSLFNEQEKALLAYLPDFQYFFHDV
ncbi:MAG: hypothetical protein ACO1N1_07815 [Dyadobacter fermentans]